VTEHQASEIGPCPKVGVVNDKVSDPQQPGPWLARAKINLYLHVTDRRADGYHCLDSLVVFADIGDTVMVEENDALTLDIVGPFANELQADESNLVWQAATALAKTAGRDAQISAPRPPWARITLHKSLPIAAGIGGGSADAAATLLALRSLWDISIDDEALAALAAPLGADVPLCLTTAPSMITGIGHDVTKATPLPPFAILLANPMQPLSTAAVFEKLAMPVPNRQSWRDEPMQQDDFFQTLSGFRNDLEAPARALCPVLDDVLAAIGKLPHCRLTRMSGSGATCFGLFDDLGDAEAAAALLLGQRANWWVRACSIGGTL